MSAASSTNLLGVQSLLSLSIAASNADRIPTASPTASDNDTSFGAVHKSTASPYKHRRLSSIGLSKKRMNDIREAAHPSPAAVQTAAAALTSLATLSVYASSPRFGGISLPHEELIDQVSDKADAKLEEMGISVSVSKSGKKRGATIFKCETCSKVYRHPSCLVKHRWEHSPHWREASKLLLSKHQQVQLLEAAAILSHLSPASSGGATLPEDRALWPSYLSGGSLSQPPAASTNSTSTSAPTSTNISSGPRMHHFALPGSTGVTHLRPGIVGVPHVTSSSPVPIAMGSSRWDSTPPLYHSGSYSHSDGGWSLPNSSIRSGSSSLPTDDEEEPELDDGVTYGFASRKQSEVDVHDEDWDGMDMDMEL